MLSRTISKNDASMMYPANRRLFTVAQSNNTFALSSSFISRALGAKASSFSQYLMHSFSKGTSSSGSSPFSLGQYIIESICRRGKATVKCLHSHFSHSSISEKYNVSRDLKEEELFP
ncbi:hypothetical protein V8G54_022566 [Vigna mungo]|uniref:Uncharacterized protein n=1 Tax=Vigna mungo TaxID=3915 RepID=A0AAQ3N3C0_VIGMU